MPHCPDVVAFGKGDATRASVPHNSSSAGDSTAKRNIATVSFLASHTSPDVTSQRKTAPPTPMVAGGCSNQYCTLSRYRCSRMTLIVSRVNRSSSNSTIPSFLTGMRVSGPRE